MRGRPLKNKPLVEALLEVKWALQGPSPDMQSDPHYKILLGRLFDRLSSDYPHHEALSSANIPDEIAGYVIQHRFRALKEGWPLIQVGPGIFTVNETDKYTTWGNFETRICKAVEKLFESYPKKEALRINSLLLRYINAINFDFTESNLFEFLSQKMGVKVVLPETFFHDSNIKNLPVGLNTSFTFGSENPKGAVHVRFASGQKDKSPAVIWEIMVQSVNETVPQMPDDFPKWANAAHEIIEDWFFKLIAGDLERRFSQNGE